MTTPNFQLPTPNRSGIASLGTFALALLIAAPPANAPAFTTALREQLGLRLESSRAPVDVLVVDQIQAPKEN